MKLIKLFSIFILSFGLVNLAKANQVEDLQHEEITCDAQFNLSEEQIEELSNIIDDPDLKESELFPLYFSYLLQNIDSADILNCSGDIYSDFLIDDNHNQNRSDSSCPDGFYPATNPLSPIEYICYKNPEDPDDKIRIILDPPDGRVWPVKIVCKNPECTEIDFKWGLITIAELRDGGCDDYGDCFYEITINIPLRKKTILKFRFDEKEGPDGFITYRFCFINNEEAPITCRDLPMNPGDNLCGFSFLPGFPEALCPPGLEPIPIDEPWPLEDAIQ